MIDLTLEQVVSLKNYSCRSNDFELAAILRDYEKQFPLDEEKERLDKILDYVKKNGTGGILVTPDWYLTDSEGGVICIPKEVPKDMIKSFASGHCVFTIKEITDAVNYLKQKL
jgi:hypothetical protein